jgi:plasmid stabilization system protein ParE
MSEIVFLKKAVEDIRKSRDWYDEKEENLGRLFVEKLNESISSIAENPRAYPEKYRSL